MSDNNGKIRRLSRNELQNAKGGAWAKGDACSCGGFSGTITQVDGGLICTSSATQGSTVGSQCGSGTKQAQA